MTDVKNDAPATEPGDKTKPTWRPPMSMLENTLGFREREPAVFAPPWDREMIRNAIIDVGGLPRGALNDLVDLWLSLNRDKLDPNYVRRPSKRAATTKSNATVDELVGRAAFQKLGPDTVMHDGRKLVDWTLGDLRKLGTGVAWIIARFVDQPDEARFGDLMQSKDWKKLAKA